MTPAHAGAHFAPSEEPKRQRVYLHAGQVHASSEPCEITTVLGSCVAVVLLDQARRIGGATHFLLPFDGSASPRFADGAITELLRQVARLGARRTDLLAKVFGGAQMLGQRHPGAKSLGAQNVESARARLARECIPIVAEDVGGDSGRKMVLFTDQGAVWVKHLAGGC